MSQISITHLTFCYEGNDRFPGSHDNIFEDVSFQIDTDWRLGFIARNGRGKTTFLKLLQGKLEYRGSITVSGSPDTAFFDYFPFPVSDPEKDTLTLLEEICPDYEFWKVCRELTLLNVDTDVFYRPFQTLSNGEQTKVMLALLFSKERHFLLIDEPTNHLDMETREKVSEYLRGKKGFILVSHDRNFLDGCIDHVLAINKRNIEVQQGNFSSWWENKRRQDAYEAAENERLKKDIKRLAQASRQARQWADRVETTKIGEKSRVHEKCIDTRAYIGEKSRRMQMRRKNLEKRMNREMEEKEALLKNVETAQELKLYPLTHHKETLLRMEDVTLSYGSKDIVTGLSLELRNGEKVALHGRNGCGKSSIIRAVLASCGVGSVAETLLVKGRIVTASGLAVSHVPQDASFLKGKVEDYAAACGMDQTLFFSLLRKLDFPRVQFEKDMEAYSGGQKKKVLLAASLCTKAHLYVWDEPLNYIDVFSRMQIEELIRAYRPTLLMVEHDRSFVDKIGARTINI